MSKKQNVLVCLLGIGLSVSTVQCLSFKFPFFSNDQQAEAAKKSIKHAVETTAKKLTNNVGMVHAEFEQILALFVGHDYFHSKKMAIQLPGINQILEIDWGFAGSGDMYKPLDGASIKLSEDPTKVEFSGNVLFDLGKIVAQQEAGKFLKDKDYLKDLTLSPVQVFCIKLMLLIKRSFESDNMAVMHEELYRLLIRLSMANNGKLFTDGKPLSSHIPQFIKESINKSNANLLKVLDEGWRLLTSSVGQLDNITASITPTVSGVVFGDPSVAAQCLKMINDNPEADVFKTIVQVAQDNGFEQAPSYQKFTELTDSKSIAYNKLFSTISLADASNTVLVKTLFTEDVQQKVASDSDLVISCIDTKGRTWLLYVSDEISIAQSVKLVLANCMKFFKEYLLIKSKLVQGSDEESQKLRSDWEAKIASRNERKSFLTSQEGGLSQKRLHESIKYISQGGPETDIQKDKLKAQRSILAHQKSELEMKLAAEQKRLNLLYPLAAYDIQDLLNEQDSICKTLSLELDSVNAQLCAINNQLENPKNIVQVERQKEIEQLMVAVLQDISSGKLDAADLQKKVAELQHELENLQEIENPLTTAQILQRRQAIAHAYDQEALFMKQKLEQRITAFNNGDDVQKLSQELRFSRTARAWQLYIDHLKKTAKMLCDENEKAQQLADYRKALKDIDPHLIDEAKRREISQLEQQVSFVLDGDSLSTLLVRVMNDDAYDILDDLNSDTSEFKDLKERFVSCLKSVMQRSGSINKYSTIYRYLVQRFQPGMLPIFDNFMSNSASTMTTDHNQQDLVLA